MSGGRGEGKRGGGRRAALGWATTPAQASGREANRYSRSLRRHVLLAPGAPRRGCKDEEGGCSLPRAPALISNRSRVAPVESQVFHTAGSRGRLHGARAVRTHQEVEQSPSPSCLAGGIDLSRPCQSVTWKTASRCRCHLISLVLSESRLQLFCEAPVRAHPSPVAPDCAP